MLAKYYSKREIGFELPDWLGRVEKEREELLTRLTALQRYLESDAFDATRIGPAQCILLQRQAVAMEEYFDILTARYELALETVENAKLRKMLNEKAEV